LRVERERSITVLWTELAEGELSVVEQAAEGAGASLVRVEPDTVAAHAFAGLAVGAVVAMARSAREASRLLGMGADEVVRVDDVSRETMDGAIARATARAAGRLSREVHRAAHDDVEPALSQLVCALEHQLSGSLGKAALDLELLATSLPTLLAVGDELVASASRPGGSSEDMKELVARRRALPESSELRRALAHVRESMGRVESTSATMRGLSSEAGVSAEAIGVIVTQTADILRPRLPSGIALSVKTQGPCRAHAPALTVALTVTALVARAVEALRAKSAANRTAEGARATIAVRVSEQLGAVVVAVEDTAGGEDTDLRPSQLEAYWATTPTPRTRLVRLRDRVRRCGGDLVVESEPSSTTVRVYFPTTAEEVLAAAGEPSRGSGDRLD